MLAYRHAFHAGNFADCFKHTLLLELLAGLARKDKPFAVLDSHAGAGVYDLGGAAADKTGEWRAGIGRLWDAPALGPELGAFRAAVAALNPDGRLRRYPGSPQLVRGALRAHDRLIACELHPADHALLKAACAGDRRVAVHRRDGYEAAGALLPPPERRGLLFVDPPYEDKREFDRLAEFVARVHRRWREGTLALWYPILDRAPSERFARRMAALGIPALLRLELGIAPYDSPHGMGGSGMLIVNPPWQLDRNAARWLPELLEHLRAGPHGQTRVDWLTPA